MEKDFEYWWEEIWMELGKFLKGNKDERRQKSCLELGGILIDCAESREGVPSSIYKTFIITWVILYNSFIHATQNTNFLHHII